MPPATHGKRDKPSPISTSAWPAVRLAAVQVREVLPKGKAAALGLRTATLLFATTDNIIRRSRSLSVAIKAPGEKPRELVVRRDGKEISYQAAPGLLGVMLGPLYAPVAADSPSSDKPAAKPAAPSSTDVRPEKKAAAPAK